MTSSILGGIVTPPPPPRHHSSLFGYPPLIARVTRDKTDFATKQRMFGLLIIDEGPSLSMTSGHTVAHFKLVCITLHYITLHYIYVVSQLT